MRFIITNKANTIDKQMVQLQSLEEFQGDFNLYGTEPLLRFKENGRLIVVFGSLFGLRRDDGIVDNNVDTNAIKSSLADKDQSSQVLGRFVVLSFSRDGSLSIWTDSFGTVDVYYLKSKNNIYIASALDMILKSCPSIDEIDNVGIMQSMYIYGGRPAKEHTWYKKIKRLGVQKTLHIDKDGLQTETVLHKPTRKKYDYHSKNALEGYSDAFFESIRSRSSENGNVVFLSSGWDSTSILATLCHLFGQSKTRAVIGRMKYSDRSGVCNQFELDRAKAIADYFGVQLDVVDLDFTKNASQYVDEVAPLFHSQQFTNLTGFNHWILSKFAAATSNGDEVVFAGEMSDGAHNFGFSQYATMFHPYSHDFREYSDKMATYLFGPTFLKVLYENGQDSDPVWNIMSEAKKGAQFETLATDNFSINLQLLKSVFLRTGRMPLISHNTQLLTPHGAKEFDEASSAAYLLEKAEALTPENLYETYIDLYNSFHWQGGTVATLYHTLEAFDFRCALPFHDSTLLDFLSYMPEDWGRGLELKPTKYPLKWMLENKLDYPMELQRGPHSYTYDVDRNFTHIGELINYSSLNPIFRDCLQTKKYESFLSEISFDYSYIEPLIKRYCDGQEIIGSEQIDLANIALLSLLGPNS